MEHPVPGTTSKNHVTSEPRLYDMWQMVHK